MELFSKEWWIKELEILVESPVNFVKSDYEQYIQQNRSKIEKAAYVFNFPIDDLIIAFNNGENILLNDDMWSKLQNSKSYKIKDLEDAIKYSLKLGIDSKQYIDYIKKGKELPLPLIIKYDIDKYYLVGGEVILSVYRALGLIPNVLQANLDNIGGNINEDISIPSPKLDEKQKKLIKEFIKFASNELKINNPPQNIVFSYDINKVKENQTFGTFEPNKNKIWLYVRNRNLADVLRTLAHEMTHYKQNEENKLNTNSGATGSNIENEANAKAGELLRNFGKENQNIYENKIYGNYLFGDKESGVKIKWYDKEKEKDQNEEKKLFDKLKAYADSEYEFYSNNNIDDLLPILKKLKQQYPDIMDPELDDNQYIYRGTAVDIDTVEKLRQDPSAQDEKHNIIIPNRKYTLKRKLASWSTHYFVAASFAINTAERRKLVPIVLRTKSSNSELFINPEFMNKLSNQPEDEILNSTNPINVDIMLIKGFDTELYPEDEELN